MIALTITACATATLILRASWWGKNKKPTANSPEAAELARRNPEELAKASNPALD